MWQQRGYLHCKAGDCTDRLNREHPTLTDATPHKWAEGEGGQSGSPAYCLVYVTAENFGYSDTGGD